LRAKHAQGSRNESRKEETPIMEVIDGVDVQKENGFLLNRGQRTWLVKISRVAITKRQRGFKYHSLIVEHVVIGVLMVGGHSSFSGHDEGCSVHILILEFHDTLPTGKERGLLKFQALAT
jgi:hypothetical protein